MEEVAKIHEITLRTIHPAIAKGAAYRLECVAKFIASQSRVNGQPRNESLCHSSVAALRNSDNTKLSM